MEPQQPTETPATLPVPPVTPATPVPPTPPVAPAPPETTPATPITPLPAVSDKKGIPLWVKIIGIVVTLIIAFVIIVSLFANQATKGAAKVGDQFVSSIQADKPSEGYGLTAPAFKQATSENSFTNIVDQVSPALQGPVSKGGKGIAKKSGQPDQATLIYTVKTDKGTMYVRIILQDNKPWQVYNFESSATKLELEN